jgi:phosphoribosylaminoimidazole carboxylase PurE protein
MSDKQRPSVAVMMGSDSDLPVMTEAVKVLEKLNVGYEVHVTSAHRSPERTAAIVSGAPARGVRVFVIGAGAAAHLAGVVAAHTTLPVLGVPLSATDLQGLDALLATVQMPAGIPVGTLAIGKAGAANAGWLAASILSLGDEQLAATLADERRKMADGVERKNEQAQQTLASLLAG